MAQITTVELSQMIGKLYENNTESIVSTALGIFNKLITNLIASPDMEKFKVIKRSNKVISEKWSPCQGVVDIAYAVGYEASDEDALVFTGEIENLDNLKQAIETVMASSSNHLHVGSTGKSNTSSQALFIANSNQGSAKDLHNKVQSSPSPENVKPHHEIEANSKTHKEEETTKHHEPTKKPQETPSHQDKSPTDPSQKSPQPQIDRKGSIKKPRELKPGEPAPDYSLEWSGSSYNGPIKDGWFEGKGRFTFPTGVVYEGDFHKGEFHGKGTLIFPNGGKYKASWNRGRAVDGEYEYYDGLIYDSQNWNYCQIPDRRFYTEIKEGLRPAGATLLVNDANGPKAMIPGTYDIGEGFYDMNQNMTFNYDGEELGPPEDADLREILDKYRYNPSNL